MSVLVTIKVPGDTEVFRQAVAERGEEFGAHAGRAQANGGIHHQFGVGPDFVLVLDEWDTVEQFETFFGDPELQSFIATIGADPGGAPEITVVEALDSADKY
jgi:hypothetical protein